MAAVPAHTPAKDAHLLGSTRHLLHAGRRRGLSARSAAGRVPSPRLWTLRRRRFTRRDRPEHPSLLRRPGRRASGRTPDGIEPRLTTAKLPRVSFDTAPAGWIADRRRERRRP